MARRYTRTSPSPEHAAYIQRYQDMHARGLKQWQGRGLPFGRILQRKIPDDAGWTALDYGCGQGRYILEQAWDVPGIVAMDGYDPGVPAFSTLPTGQYDLVVSKDVLEHILPADIPWVLDEIFGFARHQVWLIIGTEREGKRFPDGIQTNTAIYPPAWWREQLDERQQRFQVTCYARIKERHG